MSREFGNTESKSNPPAVIVIVLIILLHEFMNGVC